MPIQFECTTCENTLEIPNGSEGQQAKCPACSAIMDVPHAQTSGSNPLHETNENTNPYANTSTVNVQGPSWLNETSEITVQQIDIGWTFQATWELFKARFAILIVLFVVMLVAAIITSVGLSAFRVALEAIADLPGQDLAAVIGLAIFQNLTGQLVNTWFGIALIRIMLQIARNQPTDLALLLQSSPFMIRSFLATLLFSLMIGVGLLLFIVPGIYVMLTFWNFNYFIVDRNCGIIESFRLASAHANGNRLSILVLFLIAGGLNTIGMFAFCIGWVAAAPFCMLMLVIAYLSMTGQPFIQPRVIPNAQA